MLHPNWDICITCSSPKGPESITEQKSKRLSEPEVRED